MSKKNIPGALQTGYTTGTCASAAARCAALILCDKDKNIPDKVTVHLPRSGIYGDTATLSVHSAGYEQGKAFAEIIKNAGDDPDVTNGAIICAEIMWENENNSRQHVEITGGIGVGIATKTGLPVPVGKAAINPVPRKMIEHEVRDVLNLNKIQRSVKIIISVPDGERIARLTMNARLGIIGGISILGTRGVVIPFSSAAYRASLAITIKVAAQNYLRHLVFTTGGRSEKYAMGLYPDLQPMSFIEAGEFIGFSLKKCQAGKINKIEKITLSGMIGKLSKVAAGQLMVHSGKSAIDFLFLAQIAREAGADESMINKVLSANTAAEVAEWLDKADTGKFFDILARRCCQVCSEKVSGQMDIETLLFNMKGKLLSRQNLAKKNE